MYWLISARDTDSFSQLIERITGIWDEDPTDVSHTEFTLRLYGPCSALIVELEELGFTCTQERAAV